MPTKGNNDAAAAQKLMRERGRLADQIEGVQRLEQAVADALELVEMAEAEGDAATADAAVADLHALTTMAEEPGAVSRNAREIAKDFVAAGIDPSRSTVLRNCFGMIWSVSTFAVGNDAATPVRVVKGCIGQNRKSLSSV